MTNRWIAFSIVGCLVLLCLWVNMTLSPQSEAERAAGATDSSGADSDALPMFFVSISDVFGEIERPPVAFDHDKHTTALKAEGAEGCDACHEERESSEDKGDLQFTFMTTRHATSSNGLMDSFHEGCIACHQKRIGEGLDAGPVTCGECHVIRREHVAGVQRPRLPQYYEVLRDTYHKDCTACHSESADDVPHTVPLDWKSFYISQTEKTEADWPRLAFDHFLHDKHRQVTEGSCEPCHSISPARQKLIKAEGREPTGLDWLW
ncbi:MAG TPA: cytochrome c3 family protein, partial [Thermoguttaceae bacterium]|nr:cytochrome c3 family protein [Thermoguttaceae bacterium]